LMEWCLKRSVKEPNAIAGFTLAIFAFFEILLARDSIYTSRLS
jgi:hypothetical protein